jgi:hypothetical protein
MFMKKKIGINSLQASVYQKMSYGCPSKHEFVNLENTSCPSCFARSSSPD